MTAANPTRQTNVRRFPQTPSEENERSTTTSSTSSSSTTTVENCQNLEFLRIQDQYFDTFGLTMSRAISTVVLRDLRAGIPGYYYLYAIEQTAWAPNPSWRYTMAIMARLKQDEATKSTMNQRPAAADRQHRHTKTVEQQLYTQREYVHSDEAMDELMKDYLQGRDGHQP